MANRARRYRISRGASPAWGPSHEERRGRGEREKGRGPSTPRIFPSFSNGRLARRAQLREREGEKRRKKEKEPRRSSQNAFSHISFLAKRFRSHAAAKKGKRGEKKRKGGGGGEKREKGEKRIVFDTSSPSCLCVGPERLEGRKERGGKKGAAPET